MATAMVELPPQRVEELPLPAEIREAIHEAQKLPASSPQRRARLHVATLLREYDPSDLRAMLVRVETGGAPRSEEAAAAADEWIERLLADEAGTIDALRERASGGGEDVGPAGVSELDVPRLRQLLRNLRKAEADSGATVPADARVRGCRSALRRYLTELLGDGDLDPNDA